MCYRDLVVLAGGRSGGFREESWGGDLSEGMVSCILDI
jgi:hypothetical protein